MSTRQKICACYLMLFVSACAGCGPRLPTSPRIRVAGPAGTVIAYGETYVDVDGSTTTTEGQSGELTLPDSGVFEKDLESGHSGLRFTVTAPTAEPVTLTLFDGDAELQRQATDGAGKTIQVDVGKVAEIPERPSIPGLFVADQPSAPPGPTFPNPDPDDERVRAEDLDMLESVLNAIAEGAFDDVLQSFDPDVRNKMDQSLLRAYVETFRSNHGPFAGTEGLELEKTTENVDGHSLVTLSGELRFQDGDSEPRLVFGRFTFSENQLVDFSLHSGERDTAWFRSQSTDESNIDLARRIVGACVAGDVAQAYQMLHQPWRDVEYDSLSDFTEKTSAARERFAAGVDHVALLGKTAIPERLRFEHGCERVHFLVSLANGDRRVVRVDVTFPKFSPQLTRLEFHCSAEISDEELEVRQEFADRAKEFATKFASGEHPPLLSLLSSKQRERMDEPVIAALMSANRDKRGGFVELVDDDIQLEMSVRSGRIKSVLARGRARCENRDFPFEVAMNDALSIEKFDLEPHDFEGFHRSMDLSMLRDRGRLFVKRFLTGQVDESYEMLTGLASTYLPRNEYSAAVAEATSELGELQEIQSGDVSYCMSPMLVLSYDVQCEGANLTAHVAFGFEQWRATVIDFHLESPASREPLFSTARWIQAYEVIHHRVLATLAAGDSEQIMNLFHPKVGRVIDKDRAVRSLTEFFQRSGAFIGPESQDHSQTVGPGHFSSTGSFRFEAGNYEGRLVFADHKLTGVSFQNESDSIDTFALVKVPQQTLMSAAKFTKHCFAGDTEPAYEMLSERVKAVADLDRIREIIGEPFPVHEVKLDSARLFDSADEEIPLRMVLYFDVQYGDGQRQIAEVEMGLDEPAPAGNDRVLAFELSADARFRSSDVARDLDSLQKLGGGDVEEVVKLFPESFRSEIDPIVLGAFLEGLAEKWGKFNTITTPEFRLETTYEGGIKKTRGEGMAQFEHGTMPVLLVHRFDRIVEFTLQVAADDWMHHLDTKPFRQLAQTYVEHGFRGEIDALYEMCEAGLQESVTRDQIEAAFKHLVDKRGELRSLSFMKVSRPESKPVLIFDFDASFEKGKGVVTVTYEFSGISGGVSEFNCKFVD